MKKAFITALLVVAGLVFTSAVYAWWGDCGAGYGSGADVESVKKFQKETLSLRDELVAKKLELRSEYDKPAGDVKRTAEIKKEIIDLQAKIQVAAGKYGIQSCDTGSYDRKRHRSAGRGMMMGMGMMDGCGCR